MMSGRLKRALVLGLGESGLAMARWLVREGAAVRVADTRADPPMREALRQQLPGLDFAGGPFSPVLLDGVDLIALSPGLSMRHEPLRPLLQAAAERGIEIAGEIELFSRALARLREERGYAPQLIGVTGTNGKTTTVRMVEDMIGRWGKSVRAAGNISPSALDALGEALDAGSLPDFWVLELSSFQLASTKSLACAAAAVLNVSEDHLDWHESFADYAACKARIFAPGTYRVLGRGDKAASAMSDGTGASFGADAPAAAGQFGLVRASGIRWLACTDEAQAPRRRRRLAARGAESAAASAALAAASTHPAADAEPPLVHRLMPVDALAVRGMHNALNALAALALVRALGCPLAPALRALAQFRGQDHRTQTVARVDGVEYVDDSKGTNVGATIAAVLGLTEDAQAGQRIVLILGGDGKGQDFAPLADPVSRCARAVVLIGRDGPRIAHALRHTGVPADFAVDLPAAVRAAARQAQAGDIVLLSPACASFDAFRNYEHRAQVFVASVRQLQERSVGGDAPDARVAPQ